MLVERPAAQSCRRSAISRGSTHVWRVALSLGVPRADCLQQILSPDELTRAECYRREIDRHRFIVSRAFLRLILSTYTSTAPCAVRIAYERHAKPYMASARSPGVRFNLSHAGDVVLCAVSSDGDVGVDVEPVERAPTLVSVAEYVLSPCEREMWKRLDRNDRATALLRTWSRKESVLKCMGVGLSVPLTELDLSQIPMRNRANGDTCLLTGSDDPHYLYDLSLGRDYVAAMATTQPVSRIVLRDADQLLTPDGTRD